MPIRECIVETLSHSYLASYMIYNMQMNRGLEETIPGSARFSRPVRLSKVLAALKVWGSSMSIVHRSTFCSNVCTVAQDS